MSVENGNFDKFTSIEHTDRFMASVSVSILLTHGRSGRLILVRHGQTWGLPAGAVESTETPWNALLREIKEETNLNKENIIFVNGVDKTLPEPILLRGLNKNRVGFIYGATYSGPKIPFDGWDIIGDKTINMAACFTWQNVLKLLDSPEEIYRPEFNFPQLIHWSIEKASKSKWLSRSQLLDLWLTENQDKVKGLRLLTNIKISRSSDLLKKWSYAPPYNEWTLGKNIHGDPRKTNFARSRFNPPN